jgi:hypothetical protein
VCRGFSASVQPNARVVPQNIHWQIPYISYSIHHFNLSTFRNYVSYITQLYHRLLLVFCMTLTLPSLDCKELIVTYSTFLIHCKIWRCHCDINLYDGLLDCCLGLKMEKIYSSELLAHCRKLHNQRFTDTCWRWRQYFLPKRWHTAKVLDTATTPMHCTCSMIIMRIILLFKIWGSVRFQWTRYWVTGSYV